MLGDSFQSSVMCSLCSAFVSLVEGERGCSLEVFYEFHFVATRGFTQTMVLLLYLWKQLVIAFPLKEIFGGKVPEAVGQGITSRAINEADRGGRQPSLSALR